MAERSRGKPVDDQQPVIPLRASLAALGWSAEQLIARTNQIRACRGSTPLHPKTAYPWLRGARPSAETINDVLAVLNRYGQAPVTAADLGWDGSRRRRAHRVLDNPYDACATALLHETKGEPMHRRTFVLLSGAAVTGTALDLMVGSAEPLRAALDGDRVTPHLVDTVEGSVRQARALDDSEGSTPALLWVGGLWQTLAGILTEAHYRTPEAIRLHTAYIEMSETYGWMLFDAGKHPQAQRVYQTGLRLAREAETHPNIDRATSNLLASAAYQETWLGQPSEAQTLLAVARGRAPHSLTPRVLAVLADRQITLAGRQGDGELLRRAEDTAHNHLDTASDDQEPWWSLWLTHSDVDANAGRAWLTADQPDRAELYLAPHLALGHVTNHRDHALFASELAHTRLRTGDITGACDATRTALSLIEHIASPRVRDRLDAATTALRGRHADHPSVRALLAA
jgi:hypothetical protein